MSSITIPMKYHRVMAQWPNGPMVYMLKAYADAIHKSRNESPHHCHRYWIEYHNDMFFLPPEIGVPPVIIHFCLGVSK